MLVTFKHFRALRNQRGARPTLGGYCLPFSDGSDCDFCSEITCTFFFFFSSVYLLLPFLLLTTSTTMDYLLYLSGWVHSSVKGGIKVAIPVPSHTCVIRIKWDNMQGAHPAWCLAHTQCPGNVMILMYYYWTLSTLQKPVGCTTLFIQRFFLLFFPFPQYFNRKTTLKYILYI